MTLITSPIIHFFTGFYRIWQQPVMLNVIVTVIILFTLPAFAQYQERNDWIHYVRIAGHDLNEWSAESIIEEATQSQVFGIEVDNDIPGRYASFLNPEVKLNAIRQVSQNAHAVDNYTFVYIAGLECITDGADQLNYSFYKDHPDWVQRDRTGRPAIFGGGDAFWIRQGDEDVWISPYATDWRKQYMQHVRNIAETGVDGIYVDIPYWMTHFEGWEDTWASFDTYTTDAFMSKTGIDALNDFNPGDFTDPDFRQWVDFRIQTINDFMAEIDKNIKEVNPHCKTIAEIYPGLDTEAVRVGADVYSLYPVVDAICHEYSEGAYMAAAREPVDWFSYMAGMYTFRAFADGKPTWMLSYSWDGDENVLPADAMKLLFLSQIMAGANVWDARGHVMSESNDFKTRTEVFQWISNHEKTFYTPRKPIDPIGLYFSPVTRNYFSDDFFKSYMGTFQLLLHSHLEFQIVTPRTLGSFMGDVLILPDVRCLSEEEIYQIQSLSERHVRLICSAFSGEYDIRGNKREKNIFAQILHLDSLNQVYNRAHFYYHPMDPGKVYFKEIQNSYNQAAWAGEYRSSAFEKLRENFIDQMFNGSGYTPVVSISASPFVCSQITSVDDKIHIFITNFKGIRGSQRLHPEAEKGVMINVTTSTNHDVYLLPYLGDIKTIPSHFNDGKLSVIIPNIKQGAVIWFD